MKSDVKGLQDRWESLAQRDAEFFIWTDVAKGDDFAASGMRDAARILALVTPFLAGHDRALEFGCGIGRVTVPMARHFGEVVAVDIAPTMLAKLRSNCERSGVLNVSAVHVDEGWEHSGAVDCAYSHIVFQHIEDWTLIEAYIRRIAASLKPGGVFYAQFDTRPASWAYRVRNFLPEFVLPAAWMRGVRRIRRSARDFESAARASGMEQVYATGVGTADTVLVFRR